MLLTRVKSHVVATAKMAEFEGKKLLLVEIMTVRGGRLAPTGRHLVCVDAVGAGPGELALAVMGSSSRLAPAMRDVPTDALLIGLIDSLQAFGQELSLPEQVS